MLPENTLPSFEIALDVGVTSIETDVHLTKDDVAVLFHDARPAVNAPLIRSLTLEQLRAYHVGNAAPTPLALRFAVGRGLDPYGIPTLAEFFEFVAAYGEGGRRLLFDLELKRVPFEPETIRDDFDGTAPALLERQVVAAIRAAGVLERLRSAQFRSSQRVGDQATGANVADWRVDSRNGPMRYRKLDGGRPGRGVLSRFPFRRCRSGAPGARGEEANYSLHRK